MCSAWQASQSFPLLIPKQATPLPIINMNAKPNQIKQNQSLQIIRHDHFQLPSKFRYVQLGESLRGFFPCSHWGTRPKSRDQWGSSFFLFVVVGFIHNRFFNLVKWYKSSDIFFKDISDVYCSSSGQSKHVEERKQKQISIMKAAVTFELSILCFIQSLCVNGLRIQLLKTFIFTSSWYVVFLRWRAVLNQIFSANCNNEDYNYKPDSV